MNAPGILPGWYPLIRSGALRKKPVASVLAGTQLSVSRRPDGTVQISETVSGKPRAAADTGEWIFACHGSPLADGPAGMPLLARPCRQLHLEGCVQAGVGDVGENILDTTHTSVVHENYLRAPGGRRNVEAVLDAGEGWISATYPPGAAPGGWGARLLGAGRYAICDTFRAPGIAEVSYTDGARTVFAARFHLTPISSQETYVAVTLAVPGTGALAALKLQALRLFFLRIFAEDRAILELISKNRGPHGAAPLVFTPPDLLRPGIEAILAGRQPAAQADRIALKV